jgi:hypothetical protein
MKFLIFALIGAVIYRWISTPARRTPMPPPPPKRKPSDDYAEYEEIKD